MPKPTVGIFGLTGCAGDQLAIINCEDELLDLVELIDIKSFVMASSEFDEHCKLDIALVEGAVVTDWDERVLKQVRERSSLVVALGTCAVWGGIPALANGRDWNAMMNDVYGSTQHQWDAKPARALHEVVKVDAAITGCPIEKHEFLTAIANLLHGDLPVFVRYPVCSECKMNGNECLLVNKGAFCCGPLTVAGCDSRCPSLGVACVGCRGPAQDANYESAANMYREKGFTEFDIENRVAEFAAMHARAELAGEAV